jgi:hypothetical protein
MLIALLVSMLMYPLPLLPILFGMVFARLALISSIRSQNQAYGKRILTSLVLAAFVALLLQFIVAYADVGYMLEASGANRTTSGTYLQLQAVGDNAEKAVKKELLMRMLLESDACYSKEVICDVADMIEVSASDGGLRSKTTTSKYTGTIDKQNLVDWAWSCLWAWAGSLFVVFRVTTKKPEKS